MLSHGGLVKLSILEKKVEEKLDTFIQGKRAEKGINCVPLKSIVGFSHQLHEYNLCDYIGRGLHALEQFIRKRPHLWWMDGENVGLVSDVLRFAIFNVVAFMNENAKRNGGKNETKLSDIEKMLLKHGLTEYLIKQEINIKILFPEHDYGNLFQLQYYQKDDSAVFSCLATVVNRAILLNSVTANITDGMLLAMDSLPANEVNQIALSGDPSIFRFDFDDEKDAKSKNSGAAANGASASAAAEGTSSAANGASASAAAGASASAAAGASASAAAGASASAAAEATSSDDKWQPSRGSGQYVDVGCQTDETDEAKLLRLLIRDGFGARFAARSYANANGYQA